MGMNLISSLVGRVQEQRGAKADLFGPGQMTQAQMLEEERKRKLKAQPIGSPAAYGDPSASRRGLAGRMLGVLQGRL